MLSPERLIVPEEYSLFPEQYANGPRPLRAFDTSLSNYAAHHPEARDEGGSLLELAVDAMKNFVIRGAGNNGAKQQAIQLDCRDPAAQAANSQDWRSRDNRFVIGEMPLHTYDMIDALYDLTGASVKRDDHSPGKIWGDVIRQGSLDGEPVYFAEKYSKLLGHGLAFRLDVLSEAEALREIDPRRLTHRQAKQFISLTGMSPAIYQGTVSRRKPVLTVDNYLEIAQGYAEARERVEAVYGRFAWQTARLCHAASKLSRLILR